MWIGYFTLLAAANLYIAYHYDTDVWVNFKLYGTLGVTAAFVVFQTYLAVRAACRTIPRTRAAHERSACRHGSRRADPVRAARAPCTRN